MIDCLLKISSNFSNLSKLSNEVDNVKIAAHCRSSQLFISKIYKYLTL